MIAWVVRAATRAGQQLADAGRWVVGRRQAPAGVIAMPYGTSALTFLWIIVVITAVETTLVELIVPWAWLRWTLALVCVGSLPFVVGIVAAYRVRPHLLMADTLLVRCGRALEVEIPLGAIASVGRTIGTAPGRPGVVGSVLELGVGTVDVVITLNRQHDIDDETGESADISVVRCSADDPDQFVTLVNEHIAARRERRPVRS